MVRRPAQQNAPSLKGRGAADNPANRFERLSWVEDGSEDFAAYSKSEPTQFFRDHSKSILAKNESPDLGFNYSINPYRGCEHGCIYCYARPYHEYLGFSAGLDFETKILIKERAPELLKQALQKKSWQPQTVAMSGATDCYQPVERRLKLTRSCLEVFLAFRNPVGIVTKNALILRDIDLLQALNENGLVAVYISVTTLDRDLARVLEPRTSTPKERIRTIEELSAVGIPTGVMVAPVIPALTDSEMPAILQAARQAGATRGAYIMMRLAHGLKDLFSSWLARHFPARRDKVLHRMESIRGGKLNDPNFQTRMRGEGVFADQFAQFFAMQCRRLGFNQEPLKLNSADFQNPFVQEQMDLGF